MTETEIIYLIAGIALIGGLIVYLVFKYEKNRREALRQFAMSAGFSYEKNFKPGPEFEGFKLFNRGHHRKAANLMSCTRGGVSYKIFDYRYTTGGGQHSHTYRQTVAFALLKQTNLPQFMLGPENFFHKIGEKFGFRDIDFDQFPGFSDHYLLRGENEEAIRELFKPRLLEYFQDKKLKTTLEGRGNGLILFKTAKRFKPGELNAFFNQCREIVTLFDRQ
jgi:hypothetical protein